MNAINDNYTYIYLLYYKITVNVPNLGKFYMGV